MRNRKCNTHPQITLIAQIFLPSASSAKSADKTSRESRRDQSIPFAGAPRPPFVRLIYLFARCNLSRLQKGFDEFSFAANGHAGKFLEPVAVGNFGVGVQPLREQDNLFVGNATLAHSG